MRTELHEVDPDLIGRPSLHPLRSLAGVSDAEISAAVAEAALLPMLMATVHLEGSLDILAEAGVTTIPAFSGDATGGLSAETQVKLRQRIVAAACAWRDAGSPEPYHPTDAELRVMFDRLAGKALDANYTPMLTQELGLSGDDRAFRWHQPVADADKARLETVIIGAGLSGLVMGYRLKQAGIPFVIIEKNDGPGGTWYENRYPGARVDVPSHCYSYSFTRGYPWPEMFSPWPVLRAYFAQMADRLGLTPHIRYETEVLRASWVAERGGWDVQIRAGDGEETLRPTNLVSAVGQLNRPAIPAIPGEESFRGLRTHTSRWPEGLSIAGKKVAVIGTAATALQLIPELAKDAAKVTVFQRSPSWVFVHPEYRRTIKDSEQWAVDHLPGYAAWFRVLLYNWAGDGTPEHMIIDPEWPRDSGSVSAANFAARERLTAGMKAAIGDHPELIDKLIPSYPPFVKRPNLGDGGFFRVLSQPNVELVTEGVSQFVPNGLVDSAGTVHDADIVVYATGFRVQQYLAPMEIVGRGGRSISEYWNDEARAYVGITVPEFPNLFLMYGPGTNLGYNGNLFFNGECQANYIAEAIRWMGEAGLAAVEVKQTVYDDYAARMDEKLARFTWSHGGATNWYRNKAGKVTANSPWPLVQYWEWTRGPVHAEYIATPVQDRATAA